MLDYAARAQQVSREHARQKERVIKACVGAGFHVACFETQAGYPVPDEQHPEILRGAYGRELARFWVEWGDTAATVRCRIAEDVTDAVAQGGGWGRYFA